MDKDKNNKKSGGKPELPVLPKPDASNKPRQSVFITILQLVGIIVGCVWIFLIAVGFLLTDDPFWEWDMGGSCNESMVIKILRLAADNFAVSIALCIIGIGSIIFLIVSKKGNDDK